MLKIAHSRSFLEAGCDEAGRGCLAGPVFAAAVILPGRKKELDILNKVDDSKKLSALYRTELRPLIEKTALSFAVATASVEEIDTMNILNASILAMHRAIGQLKTEPGKLLIDGNRFKSFSNKKGEVVPHQCIIKGDGIYLSIACASILAKTYRDDFMNSLHEKHPEFGWNSNKGYGTETHRQAIEKFGPTLHHRRSFTLLPRQLKLKF